jgi:hypothetical protein
MKSKNLIYALLIIVVVFLTSCEKEVIENVKNLSCSNMLYFETVEEYNTELNKVIKMNESELTQWEKSKGFISLGIEAERFYKSIDPNKFKSNDEIKQFVDENSSYLQLIEDKNGELELETKFFNRIERYFLNKDNMFQIGDSVYKVFESATIIASTADIDILSQVSDNINYYKQNANFRILSTNKFSTVNQKSVNADDCGTGQIWRSDNDNERLKVEIEVYKSGSNSVTCHFISRPYNKVLGIWYWCSRSMKADINLNFRYFCRVLDNPATYTWQNNGLIFYNNYITESKFEDTETFTASDIYNSDEFHPRFISYDVWVDTDQVSPIDIECTSYF